MLVYKLKGNQLKWGLYRAIRLQEHGMIVVERVTKSRIWEQVDVDEMQFESRACRGMTDAIFTASQVQG